MEVKAKFENDLIIRAAKGEYVERVPVWVMRQAGRILPEYRAVRASVSGFKELVKTPELAAEVTLQPVRRLGVDAAIIFSDILVIPEALGLNYEMVEKKGPFFPKTIDSEQGLSLLKDINPTEDLGYVTEAIQIVKKDLNGTVPLIGFAGAPFTLLCYMIEGSGSKTFSKARKLLYQKPQLAHAILDKITNASILYLNAQIDAGADLIQVFDSWAGILNYPLYKEFSQPYIEKICEGVNGRVPVTVFAKGAYFAFDLFKSSCCNVVGLDWSMSVENARNVLANKTLQGNLDPTALYGDKQMIKELTVQMLEKFGKQNYIANLGHGVYPDTDPDKVKFFIDTVKEYSSKMQ